MALEQRAIQRILITKPLTQLHESDKYETIFSITTRPTRGRRSPKPQPLEAIEQETTLHRCSLAEMDQQLKSMHGHLLQTQVEGEGRQGKDRSEQESSDEEESGQANITPSPPKQHKDMLLPQVHMRGGAGRSRPISITSSAGSSIRSWNDDMYGLRSTRIQRDSQDYTEEDGDARSSEEGGSSIQGINDEKEIRTLSPAVSIPSRSKSPPNQSPWDPIPLNEKKGASSRSSDDNSSAVPRGALPYSPLKGDDDVYLGSPVSRQGTPRSPFLPRKELVGIPSGKYVGEGTSFPSSSRRWQRDDGFKHRPEQLESNEFAATAAEAAPLRSPIEDSYHAPSPPQQQQQQQRNTGSPRPSHSPYRPVRSDELFFNSPTQLAGIGSQDSDRNWDRIVSPPPTLTPPRPQAHANRQSIESTVSRWEGAGYSELEPWDSISAVGGESGRTETREITAYGGPAATAFPRLAPLASLSEEPDRRLRGPVRHSEGRGGIGEAREGMDRQRGGSNREVNQIYMEHNEVLRMITHDPLMSMVQKQREINDALERLQRRLEYAWARQRQHEGEAHVFDSQSPRLPSPGFRSGQVPRQQQQEIHRVLDLRGYRPRQRSFWSSTGKKLGQVLRWTLSVPRNSNLSTTIRADVPRRPLPPPPPPPPPFKTASNSAHASVDTFHRIMIPDRQVAPDQTSDPQPATVTSPRFASSKATYIGSPGLLPQQRVSAKARYYDQDRGRGRRFSAITQWPIFPNEWRSSKLGRG